MQKGRHKEVLFFCPTVGGARILWLRGLLSPPPKKKKKNHTQGEYLTTWRDFNSGRGHHTEQLRTRSVLHQNRKKTNHRSFLSVSQCSPTPSGFTDLWSFCCCSWCINWEMNKKRLPVNMFMVNMIPPPFRNLQVLFSGYFLKRI